MAFNPNSITPSENFVNYVVRTYGNGIQSATFWARWGATQAAEALKYQMPTDGILDRPPTAEDANEGGYVQVLGDFSDCSKTDGTRSVWWSLQGWEIAAERGYAWLHTPDWVPDPKLALKREGAALLNRILPIVLDDEGSSISPEQIALLRRVAALIPEGTESGCNKTTSATPLTIDGHVVKPGDRLTLRNNKIITVHKISWGDDLWQVVYGVPPQSCVGLNLISVYANGVCPFEDGQDILAVVARADDCAVEMLQ
jgi:hypothetical protein